jgi:drug/metabolite transporter (DMT)-like permease
MTFSEARKYSSMSIESSRKNSEHTAINMRGATMLIVTVLLWSSAFAGIRSALQSYSPGALILLRFLIASVALIIYALITRLRLPDLRDVPALLLLGFFGITVYQAGLTFGEQTVPAGTASFLISCVPCFTALFAVLFLKERLSRWGWAGVLLSFIGVTIISFGSGSGFSFTPDTLLILIAAFSESIYFIFQKNYLSKYNSIELTAYTIWAGTLFMLVFAPQLIQQMPVASLASTLSIVYMGIFPAAIAYVTWAYTLSHLPASRASSLLNFIPLLSSLIAWIWLREIPSPLAFWGGILVIAGVLLVNKRSKQSLKEETVNNQAEEIAYTTNTGH